MFDGLSYSFWHAAEALQRLLRARLGSGPLFSRSWFFPDGSRKLKWFVIAVARIPLHAGGGVRDLHINAFSSCLLLSPREGSAGVWKTGVGATDFCKTKLTTIAKQQLRQRLHQQQQQQLQHQLKDDCCNNSNYYKTTVVTTCKTNCDTKVAASITELQLQLQNNGCNGNGNTTVAYKSCDNKCKTTVATSQLQSVRSAKTTKGFRSLVGRKT